tara:strand:+ start:172 stop:1134 length:963 start_codon:yes stop_codon:yes gene_type:complete
MVTGVGAIMGYGLLRSLRQARPHVRLIGADIHADAVGQAWCDAFEHAPLTSSAAYPEWLRDVVARHAVELLIPGFEQDVHRLSSERDMLAGLDCAMVLNDARLVELSQDKWAMHQELRAVGDELRIPSFLEGDFDALAAMLGLPFILKPRRSYAGKGLVRVQCRDDFAAHAASLGEVLMAQPLIGCDDEEYTVGVFGDGRGAVSCAITMRRRLALDGATAKAWVCQDASLDDAVCRLCRHFRPVGPTNLQFRRDAAGWKLLEINPRVSSTTSMRAAFGYNEGAMCMDYYLDGALPAQPRIRSGFAVRYIQDYVIHDRDHF